MSAYRYSTLAVHAGQHPDPLTGAVNVPLYLSSTFELTGIGTDRAGTTRAPATPRATALKRPWPRSKVASAATHSPPAWLPSPPSWHAAGRRPHALHRATSTPARCASSTRSSADYGIQIEYVDTDNLDAVDAAIKPNTKLVHIETPSNPLMVLTDIAAVSELAHARGAEVSVDNTFLSPALQSPLALGADIVMHSTTKFLNGHSDGLGGALIGSKPEHKERFCSFRRPRAASCRPSSVSSSCAASRPCPCA